MAEEQTPGGVQDPVQSQQAAPAQQTAPVQQTQLPTPGPAPWSEELQTRFDPQTAAQVDAYLRQTWQPRVTQLEQRYAETENARQMLDAFNTDPDAANVAVNRQLYGNEYGDQLAAALGRTDLLVNPQGAAPQQPQYQQPAPQQPQQVELPPEYKSALDAMVEQQQQQQYDAAKADFLKDPQYADIDSDLFDVFVGNAETWDEAVSMYRAWDAQHAARYQPAPEQQLAPPVIGSQAGGAPGSTPSAPRETLNEAIDAIFSEQKPIAPPVIGGQ